MTRYNLAKTAYGAPNSSVRSPRSTEYDLFSRVTRMLKASIETKDSDFSKLVSALHDNRRMWTMIAGSVSEKENQLPQDLRAKLFYLAEFTNEYTSQVLQSGASATPLLDINAAVMSGLQGRTQSV